MGQTNKLHKGGKPSITVITAITGGQVSFELGGQCPSPLSLPSLSHTHTHTHTHIHTHTLKVGPACSMYSVVHNTGQSIINGSNHPWLPKIITSIFQIFSKPSHHKLITYSCVTAILFVIQLNTKWTISA